MTAPRYNGISAIDYRITVERGGPARERASAAASSVLARGHFRDSAFRQRVDVSVDRGRGNEQQGLSWTRDLDKSQPD